jgi:hypothetical protein
MGTPLRHIVDDIVVDLRQNFDDKRIIPSQIAYWVILVGNRLKAQHIKKRSSGAFMTTFAEVPVQVSDVIGDNLVRYRKYIDLPDCIYDFHNDAGIHYISYSHPEELPNELPPLTQVKFGRTTPAGLKALYANPYTKPDRKNPYFYRTKNRLYLLGLECVNVKNVEIGLWLTLDPVTEIDLDADFEFPEELLFVLKKQVLDMGRFALLMPQERVNDGDDDTNPNQVPTNKITSVNDPINQSDS